MNDSKLKILALLFCFANILWSCKSSEQTQKLPQCIDLKIETLKNQPLQNPPSEVWSWEQNGTTFYYFNAPCCDQFSYLYDANCNVICAPDGGFTGRGDGKCPEFSDTISKTLIWKDERKS